MDFFYAPGRNHLFVPGPVNIPEPVIRAMNRNNEDYRSPAVPALTKTLLEDVKKIFKTTSGTPFLIPTTGTGAWESALTNTLSPGDKIVSFLIGQFSLLWIDQQQRLNFNVDVIESEWGRGADLDALASKLAADWSHSIKAVCIVHNETATGVTNNLATVRKLLDEHNHPALVLVDGVSSICAIDFRMDEWGVVLDQRRWSNGPDHLSPLLIYLYKGWSETIASQHTMAEELIAGVCSSSSSWWWCTAMSGSSDWAAAAIDMFDVLPRSCNESSPASVSDSSISFQDVHFSPVSAAPAVFDSVPAAMATSSWSQPLFGTAGRAESCLHELFQGDMIHQESLMQGRSEQSFTEQSFSVDINGARLYQESLALPSALQNESSRSSSDESMQLMRSSPPKQQLQLSNTTTSPIPSAPWSFDNPMPTHLPQQAFDEPFNCSDQRAKSNSRARDSMSAWEKRSTTEPALKKPRIETPSPLPTFKVRKEKLGDRITALQQLVSPFGKTDTASVLHEAIDYIKFLHDQVRVLSSPHMKSGHQIQQVKSLDKPKHRQGPEEDLRSRGLCVVPVSATFAVARETAMDFWTPFQL